MNEIVNIQVERCRKNTAELLVVAQHKLCNAVLYAQQSHTNRHTFVIDFDKPSARVYMGSYNFSGAADNTNGENLLLIKDRRIAVSYMIEALRLFDHYHFRVRQEEAATAVTTLELKKPPGNAGEVEWWKQYYTDTHRVKDRLLFA